MINIGIKITHDEFIKRLEIKNPKAYRELIFLEKYTNSQTNVLVSNKYGKMKVKPNNLLNGKSVTIMSAVDKTEYFKNAER